MKKRTQNLAMTRQKPISKQQNNPMGTSRGKTRDFFHHHQTHNRRRGVKTEHTHTINDANRKTANYCRRRDGGL